jgi:DHA2 family multidrug resistance protein
MREPQQEIDVPVKPDPESGVVGVAVILAGVFAMLLDASATNMINTGLPFLQGQVSATPDEGSWLLTVYNAMYYASIGLSPWLYVRFGKKRLLLISLAGFAATSLALFSVTSLDVMLVLRAAQGAFAGAIFVPAALLMFMSLPPKLLPFGIPAFALVALTGAAAGVLVGGYFAEAFGAGSVFLPGAAATIVVGVLVWWAAPNNDQRERRPFDGLGVGLSVVMFGAMQYLANEGERRDWFSDGTVVLASVVLAITAIALIAWEWWGARHPHLDLHLFSGFRNLRIGALISVLVGFLGYSVTVFVVFLQDTVGASATTSGEMIMLRVLTYLIGIPLVYVLVARKVLDVRLALILSAIGTALCFVAFSHLMTTTAAIGSFVGITLIFGFFFAALNQPTPGLVLGGLPPTAFLAALPIYKLSAPIGVMLAFGICQTFLDHRTTLVQTQIASAMTLQNPSVALFLARGGSPATLAGLAAGQSTVVAQAALTFVFGLATLLLIPMIVFVQVAKPAPAQPPASP